jgi:hypothetical protein
LGGSRLHRQPTVSRAWLLSLNEAPTGSRNAFRWKISRGSEIIYKRIRNYARQRSKERRCGTGDRGGAACKPACMWGSAHCAYASAGPRSLSVCVPIQAASARSARHEQRPSFRMAVALCIRVPGRLPWTDGELRARCSVRETASLWPQHCERIAVWRMAPGERLTPFFDDSQASEEMHGLSD